MKHCVLLLITPWIYVINVENCTLISATSGEVTYIKKNLTETYTKNSNRKCSQTNIGTFDDDDCEARCDNNGKCGAFVIFSSNQCKIYGEEAMNLVCNAAHCGNISSIN